MRFRAPSFCALTIVASTWILTLFFVVSLIAPSAVAQDKKGGGDLGTQATNPAAALIQLQLQDQFIPSTHNADGVANTADYPARLSIPSE